MGPIARWGYLENHDGARDYEDMKNRTDIGSYKVPPKETLFGKQGSDPRAFKQCRGEMHGADGDDFMEMKSLLEKMADKAKF